MSGILFSPQAAKLVVDHIASNFKPRMYVGAAAGAAVALYALDFFADRPELPIKKEINYSQNENDIAKVLLVSFCAGTGAVLGLMFS